MVWHINHFHARPHTRMTVYANDSKSLEELVGSQCSLQSSPLAKGLAENPWTVATVAPNNTTNENVAIRFIVRKVQNL